MISRNSDFNVGTLSIPWSLYEFNQAVEDNCLICLCPIASLDIKTKWKYFWPLSLVVTKYISFPNPILNSGWSLAIFCWYWFISIWQDIHSWSVIAIPLKPISIALLTKSFGRFIQSSKRILLYIVWLCVSKRLSSTSKLFSIIFSTFLMSIHILYHIFIKKSSQKF